MTININKQLILESGHFDNPKLSRNNVRNSLRRSQYAQALNHEHNMKKLNNHYKAAEYKSPMERNISRQIDKRLKNAPKFVTSHQRFHPVDTSKKLAYNSPANMQSGDSLHSPSSNFKSDYKEKDKNDSARSFNY